jgi:hypothetical protein
VTLLLLLLACARPDPNQTSSDDSTGDSDETDETDVPAVSFDAIGFNVESGGSDPEIVASETIAYIEGESIWGFVEVENEAAAETVVAAAKDEGSDQDFQYVVGTTGGYDLMVLAWDDERFDLLGWEELDYINIGGNVRAPLVAEMEERTTGQRFTFVVNHLFRTDDGARHEQAELLHDWGEGQDGPVIMVGDYNFDWDLEEDYHDQGYDSLTAGGVFEWVEPDVLVKTQCSPYYNSVLDFVFVGGEAQGWPAEAEILRAGDEYCAQRNIETFSDHRPMKVTIELPGS